MPRDKSRSATAGDDAPVGRAGAGQCRTIASHALSSRLTARHRHDGTGIQRDGSRGPPQEAIGLGPGGSRAPSRDPSRGVRRRSRPRGARQEAFHAASPRRKPARVRRDTARTTHWPAALSHHGRRVAVASDGPQRWPPDERERPRSPPDPASAAESTPGRSGSPIAWTRGSPARLLRVLDGGDIRHAVRQPDPTLSRGPL